MISRTRLACGVAIGYVLGRTRKMRLALMIAGATGVAGSPRQLVERGVKQLASVPEVGKLTTIARGQLLDAAKTAAMTAASSRIDALNERLQGTAAGGTGEDDEPRRPADRGRADSDEDTSAEEERYSEELGEEPAEDSEESGEDAEDNTEDTGEDTGEDSGEGEAPRPRRRAGTARRRAGTDDSDGKPRRGSTRRSSRSPVRRAGK